MTEHLEFSTAAKVRKSLLIFSIIGIFLKETQKYNTGKIAFLGFEVPVQEFDVVLNFFIAIIVFYLVAFVLRTSSDWASDKIVHHNDELEVIKSSVHSAEDVHNHINASKKEDVVAHDLNSVSTKIEKKHLIVRRIKNFLDLGFPIGFGILAIVWIICI